MNHGLGLGAFFIFSKRLKYLGIKVKKDNCLSCHYSRNIHESKKNCRYKGRLHLKNKKNYGKFHNW